MTVFSDVYFDDMSRKRFSDFEWDYFSALNLFVTSFKMRSEGKKRELKMWHDILFVPSGLKEKRVRGRLGVKTW